MGKLLKGKKPPKPKEAAPLPDEENAKAEARKRQAELQARSGLQSTLLSDTSKETLG